MRHNTSRKLVNKQNIHRSANKFTIECTEFLGVLSLGSVVFCINPTCPRLLSSKIQDSRSAASAYVMLAGLALMPSFFDCLIIQFLMRSPFV